ncbi:D-alpha,beta-D-heptose 1,7-bisphosphate phosphatase [Marinoscillum furvescens DSM 4134]|uniref:D,D-heptose 1,7-bisphosphate phosphatase n=1 Tax=Marinoscillum furvescens DSM 4134 TaxID=1122208 RepID=A0A3D9L2R2_MARFU|nr:D-alpha,beta-D-heptose 1,7-bisphosphate phosphatase [Marinoscillum furvescens DSM 4134]
MDRDGVINKDYVDYAYTLDRFQILPGVKEAVTQLKKAGYLCVVITNQSGIAKGIYTRAQMEECHQYMQQELNHQIDRIYYAPWHPDHSESLSRKPGTLMFERAIARFDIDVNKSWMIGDKKRDLIPALKVGLHTAQVGGLDDGLAEIVEADLHAAVQLILRS